ncbi:hypothetical protein G4B88_015361 [Cannabis sativa]|uniref:Uncharacterized protein n=1 Tax=Cannabis sativa TaxID=3483 RepID=A0A7J6ECR4_CANSA|nr:hypothetical protein G4B88_015361 [Cannabis sativa]
MGKPTPKVEVMKFLKGKGYTDAKDYAGECEPVVIIAKGQNVQGTCKYGTRVDYVMSSSESPYKYIPGSYSVVSSKGTSDHHLVKVDIVKESKSCVEENIIKRQHKLIQKLVSVTRSSCSSKAKQQEKAQRTMRTASKDLLTAEQEPLLVRTGLRNWNRNTVPVGRSFIRFPTPLNVLFFTFVVNDVVLAPPIIIIGN